MFLRTPCPVRPRRCRALAFSSVLGMVLAATLAGCGGGSSGADRAVSPTTGSPSPASPASAPFGSGCPSASADSGGGLNMMATAPVTAAADADPTLSTLARAIRTAGLGDALNSARDITVFAPDNAAFVAMDQTTRARTMTDPQGLLRELLESHVVDHRITTAELSHGHFTTVEGRTLSTAGSHWAFTVGPDRAHIVCGGIQTANATVYIIDQVLLPAG